MMTQVKAKKLTYLKKFFNFSIHAIQRSAFGKISLPHVVHTLHMTGKPQSSGRKQVLYINTAQSQKGTLPVSSRATPLNRNHQN